VRNYSMATSYSTGKIHTLNNLLHSTHVRNTVQSNRCTPRRSGRSRFSSTSRASVPSSIKSSLVMTPMVRSPANGQKFSFVTILQYGQLIVKCCNTTHNKLPTAEQKQNNRSNTINVCLRNVGTHYFKLDINLNKTMLTT